MKDKELNLSNEEVGIKVGDGIVMFCPSKAVKEMIGEFMEKLKEVKKFGQKDAKRILGNDLPKSFVNQFLDGDSLFTDIINKTIDLTHTQDLKDELKFLEKIRDTSFKEKWKHPYSLIEESIAKIKSELGLSK